MSEVAAFRGLTLDAWRQESRDPESAIDRLQDLIGAAETRLCALVPEEGRFDRLRRAMADSSTGLLSRAPIGIKDIFQVEGLETRAGSRLPPDQLSGAEASSVTALRRAGGVVLGKTVTTEFAYFAPGPTRNPHDLDHTPGGSSSGSAAAVAAGYCPLALGTQTIGSISRPASFCGIVGFKPTYGRIPADGVIPLAPSLDHVGVFANSTSDAAVAADVLCTDWQGVEVSGPPVLGIPRGPFLDRATSEGLRHFERQCAALEAAGWALREVRMFDDFSSVEVRHRSILAAEVARAHQQWFERFAERYDARTRELVEQGQQISQTTLISALEERRRFQQDLHRLTESEGVDLWVSPAATGPAPRGLESTGDPVMNLPWTQAGVPTLALPTDRSGVSLPMGLQLAGRWGDDERLLAWGVQIEIALRGAA